ncbi:LRR receptor-like serine/threonine-protein kinase IOS1 [Impatiens glandulifera]|uniref:LRR receptor-like serine/threonine-protein kinase IOS1 n=1 Tax=Impatiens glandulifera TaxID=253017 RepID=UPI001FB0A11B|nr:LRR receptor-like serine/threonine-protein kinase IOS1 [Impatiens glandulifera]
MATRLLPLIVLALSSFMIYATNMNIDCGTTTSYYTDANSIIWIGDEDLNTNGIVRTVGKDNSNSYVMDSMRVFTSLNRNCYDIPSTSGNKVFIRTSFYYGNYDGKSAPPSFLLTLDGNSWVTVETTSNTVVSHEAIWVVKGDTVSICLCQTKSGQVPFISALQVYDMDSSMYSKVSDSFTLFTAFRVSYGTDQTIRYSDDAYDRIWNPASIGTGLLVKTNDNPLSSTDLPDQPPVAVFANAITTLSISQSIQATIPVALSPVYINFYFSEVTQLDTTTDSRLFRIFMNNNSISGPISPPYGDALEMSFANLNLTSDTIFSLDATGNSTLPPIISAMEVFQVVAGLNAQTNSLDFDGLSQIFKTFSTKQQSLWGGDPCLPAPYSWDWIGCSSDTMPRVTELNVSGYGLSGSLPDFSSMTALEIIDLSDNSFSGGILDFLGTFPNLKQLNLANNQFSGPIPSSISKNNKIKFTVTGNPDVCATGSSCATLDSTPTSVGTTPTPFVVTSRKKKSNTGAIVGSIVPIFVVFWAVVGGLVVRHKRQKAAMAAVGGVGAGTGVQGSAGGVVGQKPNGNVNQNPEASPAYLLGKQFGAGVTEEIIDNQQQHQGDEQNNNHNYNNV